MAALNSVSLIGYLGQDPRLNVTGTGKKVANFSVGTTEYNVTEWHQISVWEKDAERAMSMLKKGQLVFVQGRLQSEAYMNKQGVEQKITKIVANKFQLLDKIEQEHPQQPQESSFARLPQEQQPSSFARPPVSSFARQPPPNHMGGFDPEQDTPF